MIITLNTRRSNYGEEGAAAASITVEELIEVLSDFPQDAKIITGHDSGYTFGEIYEYDFEYEE